MRNRGKIKITYFLLFLFALFLGVAYAFLQANLNINGISQIGSNTWDIHFDNIKVSSGSVLINTENEEQEVLIDENDNTKISYSVSLSKPGDYYEFMVDAVNDGSIDGMVDSIVSKLNDSVVVTLPGYLSYSLKYLDGTNVSENHIIRSGETETYIVRVEYSGDDLPEEAVTASFELDVNYKQADDTAVDTRTNFIVNHKYAKLDSGYDEVVKRMKAEPNSEVTPPVLEREGFISPTPQTVTVNSSGTTVVNYIYERVQVHLTLDNVENIETTTLTGDYSYGTPITLTAKPIEYYVFVKWSNNSTDNPITFDLIEDTTIGPIYAENYYTVTLNAGSGSVDPASVQITKGQAVGELPTPEYTGYYFDGWYTELPNGDLVDDSYVPESDINVVANWKKSVASATITNSEITLAPEEEETINISNAAEIGESYTFASSDTSVATVDQNGKVTGVTAGTTTITITGSNSHETKTVSVTVETRWNITYDSNDGEFSDSSTINQVSYNISEGTVTKYSHTSNVDDTGLKTTNYGNNWNNSNITGTDRGDTSNAHVVSNPGASSLTIDVYYNGEDTSYDWLSVWVGNHPDYTAENDCESDDSVTIDMGGLEYNQYGGEQYEEYEVNGNNLTEMGHSTLIIPGDTVTFGFTSDVSGCGQGYGYYAIVTGNVLIPTVDTGTYKEPTKTNYLFTGWNTKRDGSGTSIPSDSYIVNLTNANTTLYAQYRKVTATFTTGQLFNQAIKRASGSSEATYSTTNSNITSFTKYTGEVTQELLNNATLVSSNNSEADIYAWFNNGTIYYYTLADTIYFNPTSTYMFNYLKNLTTLDLSNFNLSKITSSSSMFNNMTNLDTIITPKVNTKNEEISLPNTFVNQSNEEYSNLTSYTPTETSLKIPYIIEFNLNGGVNSTCSAITNIKKLYPGNPIGTIPTITANKFGYVQGGWCLESSCSSTINLTESTIPPSSISYYIEWTKDGVWAENISYSHSGINCSDTQCLLEYLANNYKEKRVSVNGN